MDLDTLLKPKSVAVLGASKNPNSIGGRPVRFLKEFGFKGAIIPVNPKYEELQGLPCYPDLDSLPEAAELLIVAVKAEMVPAAIEKAAANGIQSAMIVSSGFGEVGGDGLEMQKKIAAVARQHNMPIMGPNCQGFIDHYRGITATFTGALLRDNFYKGSVAFVSQSGAMGYHFYAMAQEMGLGFSYMISSGNEAVLTAGDYLKYVLKDENTKVAAAYMEGLSDPAVLRECANFALKQDKPFLVMKVGRSSAGSRAASSHTGSLAGEDRLVDSFFNQEGILRVNRVGQFFDLFKAFNCGKRLKGNKIAIVSISGGAGVVIADECEEVGMKVVDFAPETESTLSGLLPNFGSEKNPVDLTAQVLGHSEGWYRSIKCVADDPNTDAVVVFIGLLEHMKDELIPPLVKINSETDKPILVTWMACDEAIRKDFRENGIPLYEEPHRCVYALSMMNKYRTLREIQAERVSSPVSVDVGASGVFESSENMSGVLDEVTSKKILARAGLPTANEVLITSRDDAPAALDQVNGRAVMKVVSREIPHKSDVGGVVLDIREPEKATRAFDQIMHNVRQAKPDANIEGVLVSEMVDSDLEMLVGLKNDPVFGPVIMTGLGGVFVEIFQDVSTRVLPIGKWDAHSMLKELKGYPLLLGVRDGKKKDIEAVVETLVRVGNLGMSLGSRLAEMDINPLMVMSEGGGVKAVDALISLK